MLGKLKPRKGSTHRKMRLGKGIGSGSGKTASRGTKGQRARSGGKGSRGFEGGQMPLQRRLPKRGFNNPFAVGYVEITTAQLNKLPDNSKVDIALLREHGFARKTDARFKVILKGNVEKKLNVVAYACSKGALASIQAKGGSVEVKRA